MTKLFILEIDEYQATVYLNAIRSKQDVVVLWMETIKNFQVGQPAAGVKIRAQLAIVIDSMSRLFCTIEGGKKLFSLAFPFTVLEKERQLHFFSREGVEIDSRTSSNIISLVNSGGIFGAQDFSAFIDPIMELSDFDPQLWVLMRELMIAEDGYLRYDWDEARQDGHKHPLHHLDVYYTNGSSFKVGLDKNIDRAALVSILDAATDCHYLTPKQN